MRRLPVLLLFAASSLVLIGAGAWRDTGEFDLAKIAVDSAVLFAALAFFFLVLPGRFALPTQIFIAMLLGIAAGWMLDNAGREAFVTDYLGVFGQLFLLPLKMVIVPLVFVSVLLGAAGLGDIRKLGSVGSKTMLYFFSTTGVAVLIGLTYVNLIQPGRGMTDLRQQFETEQATKAGDTDAPAAPTAPLSAGKQLQTKILPTIFQNPVMVTDPDKAPILAIITLALMLGAALGANPQKSEGALKVLQGADGALVTLISWIMYLAPIGVFALMAGAIATLGIDYLQRLALYVVTVLLGLVTHAGFLLGVMLFLVARISPLRYLRGVAPALQVAFSTSSSNAALPVHIRCAIERVGLDRGIVQFVLPIGATVNMDGTALYTSVATLFVAEVLGIEMTLAQQFTIFVTAIVVSVGTAGIPGGSLAMMGLIYDAVGLPIEALGLVIGVDRILDMCRTTVNILGDGVGAAVVSRLEGKLGDAPVVT